MTHSRTWLGTEHAEKPIAAKHHAWPARLCCRRCGLVAHVNARHGVAFCTGHGVRQERLGVQPVPDTVAAGEADNLQDEAAE
jgi:hypothetical protein